MTDRQPGDRGADPFAALPAGSLTVLQITDTHLYGQPDGQLLGVTTLDTFGKVLHQSVAARGTPDLVLATGDLVHDGTATGYRRVREYFEGIGKPVYCIPGNHDDPQVMARVMNKGPVKVVPRAEHDDWVFIFLDSTLEGSEGGHLSDHQLALLQQGLRDSPGRQVLICLHHQPVPVGSAWMDRMVLDNAEAFFALVDRHPWVRAIVWGHIHQTFDETRNGVRLLATPSTCFQFPPGSDHFGIDPQPPGYRWLVLHPDGRIDTGVERLPSLPEGLDVGSGGY